MRTGSSSVLRRRLIWRRNSSLLCVRYGRTRGAKYRALLFLRASADHCLFSWTMWLSCHIKVSGRSGGSFSLILQTRSGSVTLHELTAWLAVWLLLIGQPNKKICKQKDRSTPVAPVFLHLSYERRNTCCPPGSLINYYRTTPVLRLAVLRAIC